MVEFHYQDTPIFNNHYQDTLLKHYTNHYTQSFEFLASEFRAERLRCFEVNGIAGVLMYMCLAQSRP